MKSPKEQLVYLQAGINDKFGDLIVLLDAIRRAERNNVGLLVLGASQASTVGRLAVTLPPEPAAEAEMVKPDRLLLQINIDGAGKIRLNNDEMGLSARLKNFARRLSPFFKIETKKEWAGNR